jgi:RND family efflux transporter MFP subunit
MLVVLALSACNTPPPKVAPIRPVLSMLVSQTSVDPLSLAGTVAARKETPFSFRVLGRLTARPVHVGDLIEKGATLAAIDPTALELAVRAAEADRASAEAQVVNATGVDERQNQLLKTNVTTQAQVEAADQARASAVANQSRTLAALAKAREQLGFAVLVADFAGVVTQTGAEVGQIVAPGQMVVQVADPAQRDAVVDAPDSAAATLDLGSAFEVAAELDPSLRVTGKVREIAPQADAATRTRRIKIALDNPPAAFRLGSTIKAWPTEGARVEVRLPASAILDRDGKSFVWVVDRATAKVASRAVTIASPRGDPVVVSEGLDPAMRVVTAGAHSLTEGQSVRLEPRDAP